MPRQMGQAVWILKDKREIHQQDSAGRVPEALRIEA